MLFCIACQILSSYRRPTKAQPQYSCTFLQLLLSHSRLFKVGLIPPFFHFLGQLRASLPLIPILSAAIQGQSSLFLWGYSNFTYAGSPDTDPAIASEGKSMFLPLKWRAAVFQISPTLSVTLQTAQHPKVRHLNAKRRWKNKTKESIRGAPSSLGFFLIIFLPSSASRIRLDESSHNQSHILCSLFTVV